LLDEAGRRSDQLEPTLRGLPMLMGVQRAGDGLRSKMIRNVAHGRREEFSIHDYLVSHLLVSVPAAAARGRVE